MEEDIHHFGRRLKSALGQLGDAGKENKKLILGFYNSYCMKQHLSLGRKEKLVGVLRQIGIRLKKPLDKITEKDLEALKISLNESGYSLHTQKAYFAILKVFIRWHNRKSELLDSAEWKIRNPYKLAENKLDPDDLPDDKTFLEMVRVSDVQQKAFLSFLYGGGMRVGGVITLKRKNLHFLDDNSLVVNFVSKGDRNSLKIHSGLASYIQTHYNSMADRSDEAPVFTRNGKAWDYSYSLRILKRIAVGAGLGKWEYYKTKAGQKARRYKGKKITAHLFRHAHATWALSNMPYALAKKRLWGKTSSKMDSIYEHITKEEENKAYDNATGNGKKEEKPKPLVRYCFKCGQGFAPTYAICPNCNIPIDRAEYEKDRQGEFKEMMFRLFNEMGIDIEKLRNAP